MKDVTVKKSDKEDYILKYEIIGDTIVVTYANKKNKVLPYSKEFVGDIESRMSFQAKKQKYLDNIKKEIKINNLVTYSSGVLSFLSTLAFAGFAITKNEIGMCSSIVFLSSNMIINNVCHKRDNELAEKKESAIKYMYYAKYLDKFNDNYNKDSKAADMTMNDADSFDLKSVKKLVKMLDKN